MEKKAKIALNILQNPKSEGGLNLVNLENKDAALKATWPKILASEHHYASIVYSEMRCKTLGSDIWRCSIQPEEVDKMRFNNQFWKDVLKSWNKYNYYWNRRIDNQIIWYNSDIKIGGKMVFWKDVYVKGLKYLYQLFQEQQFKSEAEVWTEFRLTKLRYNSLKCAIPQDWKLFFLTTKPQTYLPIAPHNYETSLQVKNLSQRVYKFLADDVMLIHSKYIKWRQDLGDSFSEGLCDFGRLHLDIYRITNVPKYRNFQYRLMQRGLVTNTQLFQWKILDNDQCTFCKTEAETLLHLFCFCPQVGELWNRVATYLMEKFNLENVSLEPKNIIFNRITPRKNHIANFICLITKHFIYVQRCMKGNINFPILNRLISKVENIEKYIAIKNNKLCTHTNKWSNTAYNPSATDLSTYTLGYINEQMISQT